MVVSSETAFQKRKALYKTYETIDENRFYERTKAEETA